MPKNIINKVVKKKIDKSCCFCGDDNYSLLDVHRIEPGSKGGKYTDHNSVTLCCRCHRLVHAGEIIIDRKYFSTLGRWLVHYWEHGEEKWA